MTAARGDVPSSGSPPWALVALGYFPLLYLGAGALLAGYSASWAALLGWLYLLPPLLCRLTLHLFGSPVVSGAVLGDRHYLLWWFLTQLQMPFQRLAFLEELLRLVPGAYALWLNLWGSAVSPLSFWSPGVVVADRYLLRVGRGAVLGARCGLTGHLVARDGDGRLRLVVARVTIGAGSVLGTGSGVGPGCRVGPGEVLPAGRLLPPFTLWRGGRKHALPEHLVSEP